MVDPFRRSPLPLRSVLLGALVLTAGCHYVKRDDFESELARVRQDMASGDQRVASQVGGQVSALEARVDARFQTLEQNLRTMEDEFGARVDRIEGSLRVHTPLHFGFNESTLQPDELPVLERLAAVLREYYPEAVVTVEGFTDPAGSRAYNQRLGQKRADEVRSYLITTGGLSEQQVRAVSYGEETARLILPGAAGPGDAGRENRRAVIVIDDPQAGSTPRAVTESDATDAATPSDVIG
jgi:peptidoglycan-associated lipoprotein